LAFLPSVVVLFCCCDEAPEAFVKQHLLPGIAPGQGKDAGQHHVPQRLWSNEPVRFMHIGNLVVAYRYFVLPFSIAGIGGGEPHDLIPHRRRGEKIPFSRRVFAPEVCLFASLASLASVCRGLVRCSGPSLHRRTNENEGRRNADRRTDHVPHHGCGGALKRSAPAYRRSTAVFAKESLPP
jgi:hypothetical protein